MVTWLAQSNRGKEDFCLFCVYGSFGHSGMICSISFSSSKHQQDIPEIPETALNFRKVSLVSLFFIIIFDLKKKKEEAYTVWYINSCSTSVVHRGA